jgi:hypothetical protein
VKKLIVLVLCSLFLAALLVTPAFATPSMLAEGWVVFSFDPEDRTRTPRGSVCIVEFKDSTRDFYGTLEGTAQENIRITVKGPCAGAFPGRSEDRGHGEGTFVGCVGERCGTLRYILKFQHHPTDPITIGGTGTGKYTILNGTGELANLRGVLETSWPPAPTQYTGRIHFDPQP